MIATLFGKQYTAWLGLKHIPGTNSIWETIDGSQFEFDNWNDTNADFSEAAINYGLLQSDGSWSVTQDDSEEHYVICKGMEGKKCGL